MARYSKTLRNFFISEVQHMQVLASHLSDARTWLAKDESRLSEQERAKLEELMASNAQLRKMIEMRRDLQAIWGRSNASREQLVAQLHAWCQRAEDSGLSSLRDFSLRLRRYA
jgi:stearoyl-CoA desaturase (delta-9 desaturase)